MILPLLVLASSCGGDDELAGRPQNEDKDPYYEGISSTSISAGRLGSIENIDVLTNIPDWTCVSDKDWCHASRVGWSISSFKVVVDENTTDQARNATITVDVNGNIATVAVTQTGVGPEIIVSDPVVTGILRRGETVLVPVSSTGSYTLQYSAGVDWISEAPESEQDMLHLVFAENTGDEERTATLTLVSDDDPSFTATITLTQFGKTYSLSGTRVAEAGIYSNTCESTEGSIYNLTDNNMGTFFHSIWSSNGVDKAGNTFAKHSNNGMIVVDLGEKVKNFYLAYTTRGGGRNNGCPVDVKVWGSASFDPSQWLSVANALTNAAYAPSDESGELLKEFTVDDDGLPKTASTQYIFGNHTLSGVGKCMQASQPVRYIWVEVVAAYNYENDGSSNSWAMSELDARLLVQNAD